MPDDQIIADLNKTSDSLKEIIPSVLMAFGAISLLRTSRFLSFVALGVYLYDAAANSDTNRKARGRDIGTKRAISRSIDAEMEDSFPASDPPSFSGTTAGAP